MLGVNPPFPDLPNRTKPILLLLVYTVSREIIPILSTCYPIIYPHCGWFFSDMIVVSHLQLFNSSQRSVDKNPKLFILPFLHFMFSLPSGNLLHSY